MKQRENTLTTNVASHIIQAERKALVAKTLRRHHSATCTVIIGLQRLHMSAWTGCRITVSAMVGLPCSCSEQERFQQITGNGCNWELPFILLRAATDTIGVKIQLRTPDPVEHSLAATPKSISRHSCDVCIHFFSTSMGVARGLGPAPNPQEKITSFLVVYMQRRSDLT